MASGLGSTPAKLSAYEPSVWEDFFINYEPRPLQKSETWMSLRVDKLKEDVHVLFKTCENMAEKLALLDAVQHLGIDHHFNEKINIMLTEIMESNCSSSSLQEVALRFRLLRENGLWVFPDVFSKLKCEEGNFSKDVTKDPKGLLSLYNAAHLLIHGEPVLEEAITYARHHLEMMKDSLDYPLSEQVKRALRVPLSRTVKRVETMHYISEYEQEEGHNSTLLELAKLDFNLLQHVHLKELKAITIWWNDFYGYVGLNYARDRVVEGYTWSYVVYHEKDFSLSRIFLAKQMILISVMDDTYDAHASIEEGRQLNTAIQRWDESATSLLPDYLKRFYTELMRVFRDVEDELATSNTYEVAYAKKAFQNQSTYYLQEAEWLHKNHKPSFKEHLNVSSMSIAVPSLSVGMLVGMGDATTKEVFEWAAAFPDVSIAGGKIARLSNDISAFKGGKPKGDVTSSLECYMDEHQITSEVAIARIHSLLEEEWRTPNQARFEHRRLFPAVQRIINLINSVTLFYADKDAYTFGVHLQKTIENLYVKPIAM